jgi:hypothetical protein
MACLEALSLWAGEWWAHTFDDAESYVALFTAVLALFTTVLSLSTIALWRSTRKLWQVSLIAAEHIRITERANINGGLGGSFMDVDGRWIYARVNNHGKTPGFVTRIAVAVCPLADLPDEPEYPQGVQPGFMMGANSSLPAKDAKAWWGGQKGCAFYGRIWFTDTFDKKNERISSFIFGHRQRVCSRNGSTKILGKHLTKSRSLERIVRREGLRPHPTPNDCACQAAPPNQKPDRESNNCR